MIAVFHCGAEAGARLRLCSSPPEGAPSAPHTRDPVLQPLWPVMSHQLLALQELARGLGRSHTQLALHSGRLLTFQHKDCAWCRLVPGVLLCGSRPYNPNPCLLYLGLEDPGSTFWEEQGFSLIRISPLMQPAGGSCLLCFTPEVAAFQQCCVCGDCEGLQPEKCHIRVIGGYSL